MIQAEMDPPDISFQPDWIIFFFCLNSSMEVKDKMMALTSIKMASSQPAVRVGEPAAFLSWANLLGC